MQTNDTDDTPDAGAPGAATPDAGASPAGTPDAGSGADAAAGDAAAPTDTRPAWEKRLDERLADFATGGTADENDDAGDDAGQAPADQAGAEGAADPDDDDAIVLALPGRHPDDDDVELALPPAQLEAILKAAGVKMSPTQLAERFAQLRNGYGRRQEVEAERRDVEQAKAKLAYIQTELQERPIDFLVDHIEDKQHLPIVESLLTRLSEDDFAKVVEKVEAWLDAPMQRERAQLDAEKSANERRSTRVQEQKTAEARARYTAQVTEQITALVPEDMDDADVQEFFDFAAHKLSTWASKQAAGTRLDPADVPKLLEQLGALEPYGLTLPAPGKGKGRGTPTSATTRTPSAPRRSASGEADLRQRAATAGQDLRARRDRRRNAAVAPAGGAASAADARPPKGQNFSQRIDWLVDRLGLKGKVKSS